MPNQNQQSIEQSKFTEEVASFNEISNNEKIKEITNEKFEEWRRIGRVLDTEKQKEIEEIIASISVLVSEIEGETIDDAKLNEFIASFEEIENGIEESVVENKPEIVRENREHYSENIENFEKEISKEKENIRKNLIKNLPEETLSIQIGNKKIEDIVIEEIDLALMSLGSEVNKIPELLLEIESENDPKKIVTKIEELFKYRSVLSQKPEEFVNSLYSWNENAEISSKTMADLNEYILSLDFFFSKKSIEEKIGISVPETSDYKDTKNLIEERQKIILDKFSKDAKFIKKYKKLSLKEITLLKADWENDIICQYIVDTFEKDNIRYKRNDNYNIDSVKMFTNYHSRKTYDSWHELTNDRERSADRLYLEQQNNFYEEVLKHPELKFIRLHIFAETSGDKNSMKIDKSFYSVCETLIETNFFNDPRLIEYKDLIIEIAEIGKIAKISSKDAEVRRIELLKKYGNEIRSPEGLGNLLYGYRRLFNTFGNNPTKLIELEQQGILSYQMLNNTEQRKGEKYKEGRSFLMTETTFKNREKIHAGKSALTREKEVERQTTFQQTGTNIEENRVEIQEDSKGIFKELLKKGKIFLNDATEIMKKSGELNTSEIIKEILKLFYDDVDVEKLNLSQEQILEEVPKEKEINRQFLENLEKKGRFEKKILDKVAKLDLSPEALAFFMEKKYYSNSLVLKVVNPENFNPKNSNNTEYFKDYLLPEISDDDPTQNMEIEGKSVPIINNPKALEYIIENFKEIGNNELNLVLKANLIDTLNIPRTAEQNEIFKKSFETIYRNIMAKPDENGLKLYFEYLLLSEKKNIQDFSDNDLEMIELIAEKDQIFAKKYLENWIEKYGEIETVKETDFKNEEQREKLVKTITTLEKVKSPLVDLIRNNIIKKSNLEIGFEMNFTENSEELGKIALDIGETTNSNKQLIAIRAFREGIYKGYNPFESEFTNAEFSNKLVEAEKIARAKTLI